MPDLRQIEEDILADRTVNGHGVEVLRRSCTSAVRSTGGRPTSLPIPPNLRRRPACGMSLIPCPALPGYAPVGFGTGMSRASAKRKVKQESW
jgi:hypothetical protein